MRISLLAGMALAAVMAAPAQAGGYYGGHHGGYYGGYGHHRHHRYGYRHHGYRHHHGRYGYLAAGLVLGAVVSEAIRNRREPERTVIYRRRLPERGYAPLPASEQVPSSRYDVFYRIEADGSCWLVERQPDGTEIADRQPNDAC